MTNKIVRFEEFSQKSSAQIEPYAKSVQIQQFMTDVAMAFSSNMQLRRAVQTEYGQISATNALKAVASLGLSLNPALKECALVTFKNKAESTRLKQEVYDTTFIPMKDGYIRKACESGNVAGIFPGSVYTNDKFTLKKTADGDDYDLEPDLDDRGSYRGSYACLVMADGRKIVHYMGKKQLEDHRARWCPNKQYKPLWWDDATFPQMGEKTCIKYVCEKNGIPILEQLPPEVAEHFQDDPELIETDAVISPAEEIANEMESDNQPESTDGDRF